MSAGVAQAPVRAVKDTRRFPRFPLSVPTDVTVLRSGIPCTIPGRSITIGERGLGVVLAGEVQAGDPVGLEFRLPDSVRLRLKAVVRYQALLQCGLEFVNMTAEQQTLIEHWTRRRSAQIPPSLSTITSAQAPAPPVAGPPITTSLIATPPPAIAASAPRVTNLYEPKQPTVKSRSLIWVVLATTLVAAAAGWWYWRRAWNELEAQLPASKTLEQPAPLTVPAEVMQTFITHKIDPIYPEAARRANIQGVVVLDTLIGEDGTVVDVRAVSGPDELATAAVDAVKWWRFQPYRINGQAVQVKTTLAVDFRRN